MKETRSLEFKEDISASFLKTVSAFANFGRGTILFGVNDEGKTVGMANPDRAGLDLENRINDSIHPKPDYSIDINRRTGVIALTVFEGRYKPYLYKGKAYRRSDTATVETDQIELKRLTLEGENLYYESLPCRETNLQFEYLGMTLKQVLGIEEVTRDVLRTFGLIDHHNQYTIAAALFSDRNSFCGIDMVRFGDSISEMLDRETSAGVSILKQYDSAVAMFRRYYQYEKIIGIQRVNVETIPETAFREALANALVHRTWDVSSHIRILMFEDRVEIMSPGGLPRGITREEYLNGYISSLRNPTIAGIFFRLHYIEMFGTGIRRIQDAYEDQGTKPSFDITDNAIRVVLPRTDRAMELSSDAQSVLEILRRGVRLPSSELAKTLGWSKDRTLRLLNALLAEGMIQRFGTGRGTKYGR